MIYRKTGLLLASVAGAAHAASLNDWTIPCTSGSCSYGMSFSSLYRIHCVNSYSIDLPASSGASGSVTIVSPYHPLTTLSLRNSFFGSRARQVPSLTLQTPPAGRSSVAHPTNYPRAFAWSATPTTKRDPRAAAICLMAQVLKTRSFVCQKM